MTRRRWAILLAAVAVTGTVTAVGVARNRYGFLAAPTGTPGAARSTSVASEPGPYRSRPNLHPPWLTLRRQGPTAGGLIMSTPKSGRSGLLISDHTGQPVWFKPVTPGRTVGNLQVGTYRGKKVLVYFEGVGGGHYQGEWHLLDTSYREVATIRAGNGAQADIHAIVLRPDGSAVVECYTPVTMDLRRYGGSPRATVFDSQIQRIDIATGKVLFDWHSLDHLPVTETYAQLSRSTVDYMHTNALFTDPSDPDLVVVSARNISQVFALNLKTGKIAWRVGGKHPTLRFADGAKDTLRVDGQRLPFSYQHDARLQPDGILTVFDNGNQRKPAFSRAAAFHLDLAAGTVTQDDAATIRHQPDLYGGAHGSTQWLPNGDTLVSWGTTGKATEYDRQGRPVAEITSTDSYVLLRQPWHATPAIPPAVSATATSSTRATVYASWNGATEVASWQVLAGPSPDDLHAVATARRTGFETAIAIPTSAYVRVRAQDVHGSPIGTSAAVPIDS